MPRDDSPKNALARRDAALARPAPTALATPPGVQSAVPALLAASVDAFGDVVKALLTDIDRAGADVSDLSWLGHTASLLEHEPAYQAALQQLRWWESFLAGLPNPTVLSDARHDELRRAAGARARARLAGLDAAKEAHRRLVHQELAAEGLDPATRALLWEIYEDPQPEEWRVDPQAFIEAALAALPPTPNIPPIVAEDLLATHNFSGFNAVASMREHPELGPRAAAMDQALAAALREGMGLKRADAAQHAQVLTGIFYLALRRALAAGSHNLAASVSILSGEGDATIQARFARELFESWVPYLSRLPEAGRPRQISGGQTLLGGLFGRRALPPPAAAPRQLTVGADPEPERPKAWDRLKRALGGKKDGS